MSTALTTSSFTDATDVTIASGTSRLRRTAPIGLRGAQFALAGRCVR